MKRVLIPVDGSPQSLEAVKAALREGPGTIQRIDLVNVQPLLHRYAARWIPRSGRDAWRSERAAQALSEARKLLEASSIQWRTHVLTGPVAAAVMHAARELRSDEIVIGSSRRNALGRVLANSISTQLCEISSIPVRVVPAAEAPALERIAVPAGLGIFALFWLAAD